MIGSFISLISKKSVLSRLYRYRLYIWHRAISNYNLNLILMRERERESLFYPASVVTTSHKSRGFGSTNSWRFYLHLLIHNLILVLTKDVNCMWVQNDSFTQHHWYNITWQQRWGFNLTQSRFSEFNFFLQALAGWYYYWCSKVVLGDHCSTLQLNDWNKNWAWVGNFHGTSYCLSLQIVGWKFVLFSIFWSLKLCI